MLAVVVRGDWERNGSRTAPFSPRWGAGEEASDLSRGSRRSAGAGREFSCAVDSDDGDDATTVTVLGAGEGDTTERKGGIAARDLLGWLCNFVAVDGDR